jgi:hypothetical protein
MLEIALHSAGSRDSPPQGKPRAGAGAIAGVALEKALAHQAAAAHQLAMRFAATANRWLDHVQAGQTFNEAHRMAMVEAQRAANASARLMLAYQDAALTLQRLRTGGRQVVQVQHVQVNSGGQAVVAGKMTTGHRGHRRGRKSK